MLAIELEAFMPVHAHGDRQVQMTKRAIGKADINEPAMGAEALQMAGLKLDNIAAQISGRIDEMASMSQHEILLKVGFGSRSGLREPALLMISGWTASVIG